MGTIVYHSLITNIYIFLYYIVANGNTSVYTYIQVYTHIYTYIRIYNIYIYK